MVAEVQTLPQAEPSPLVDRPLTFARMPDPPGLEPPGSCPRRVQQQLDLLLLAIEALDLGGAEAIPYSALRQGFEAILGSQSSRKIALWRLRATNPLRNVARREPLSLDEARVLLSIVGDLAGRLTVPIRQLTMAREKLDAQGLSLNHHFRWADYLDRFRAHFRARMNPRRAAAIPYYRDDAALDALAISLLDRLLFAAGTAGVERLWMSLFDGEVA